MNNYYDIFVNRKGISNNAFMKTIKLIEVFEKPNQNLLFDGKNIIATENVSNKIQSNTNIEIVKVQIVGKFVKLTNKCIRDNNILGSSDLFIYDNNLNIPEMNTNPENLNYYGAVLINSKDIFNLQNTKPMPLFEISVGQNYVQDYLLQENLGNGFYIESHNTPHYHQPLNEFSSGYMILAKKHDNNLIMSKFKIPFGSALYTPPNIYHSDAFLVGDYNVIYNKADNYETYMFRNYQNKIIDVK